MVADTVPAPLKHIRSWTTVQDGVAFQCDVCRGMTIISRPLSGWRSLLEKFTAPRDFIEDHADCGRKVNAQRPLQSEGREA